MHLLVLAQHSCVSRRKVAWSWGSVHWRTVVSSVQWGTFLVMLLCTLVPYLIISNHAVREPHERAFLIYDADISHPMSPNTVKGWMAPVFTFLLLLTTVSSTCNLACACVRSTLPRCPSFVFELCEGEASHKGRCFALVQEPDHAVAGNRSPLGSLC